VRVPLGKESMDGGDGVGDRGRGRRLWVDSDGRAGEQSRQCRSSSSISRHFYNFYLRVSDMLAIAAPSKLRN
jgi:hypothetical protein